MHLSNDELATISQIIDVVLGDYGRDEELELLRDRIECVLAMANLRQGR